MLNQLPEAIENYKKAIELNPQKVEAFYNLGNSYCNLEKFHDAISAYLSATAIDPMHDPAIYNMGYAYHRIG